MIIIIFLLINIFLSLIAQEGIIPKEFIKTFLPKNPTILEAGAHWGSDTVEMSKLWPQSKIYAFEPVPEIFEQLRLATRSYDNISCYSLALSNNTGLASFYISSGASDGSSSLLKPTGHITEHPTVYFTRKIPVMAITLDEWAELVGVDHIDFMWLDMQGSEYAMLQASTKILPTVKVIYTEVSLKEMYEGSILYTQFKQWLEQQGFIVVREELPWPDMGNVLLVRQ